MSEGPERVRRAPRARADDALSGTGRQIDAFGDEEPRFDLFDGPLDERGRHRLAHRVIDFKTHRVAETGTVPERCRIQADVYRSAAAALLEAAEPPRIALHFTHPNVAVEL